MSSLSPRIDNIDKNYIINGGMDLFQRSHSLLLTTSPVYATADRFQQYKSGSWTVDPTSTNSSSIPNNRSKRSLSLVGTATDGTASATIDQLIESLVVSELSGQQASFGMWVNPDANGPASVTITIEVPSALDNFSSTTIYLTQTSAITPGGGWQFVVMEGLAMPDTSLGLAVRCNFTAWASGLSGTLLTTQWTLNEGPKAGNFMRHGRSIIGEIQSCQRYYTKSYDLETDPGTASGAGASTSFTSQLGFVNQTTTFKVTMRTDPTGILYSPSGAANSISAAGSDHAAGVAAVGQYNIQTLLSGQAAGGNVSWQYIADAELT